MGILVLVPETAIWAANGGMSRLSERTGAGAGSMRRQWESQDLHLAAQELLSHRIEAGQHVLVFRRGFSVVLAGHQFASDRAVVWIKAAGAEVPDAAAAQYRVQIYLKGRVSAERAGEMKALGLQEVVIVRGEATVIALSISGEIFVTAEKREAVDPRGLSLYGEAVGAFERAGLGLPPMLESAAPLSTTAPGRDKAATDESKVGYTVILGSLSDVGFTVEYSKKDDVDLVTVIGRVYVSWQEQSADTGRSRQLELEADSLVLWRYPTDGTQQTPGLSPMRLEGASEIYVSGDVLLRDRQHTIRADELYYDLRHNRGLARRAVMRSFDAARGVPIYIWASELRQVAMNQFEADDITMTTSEFRTPQVSLGVAKVRIIDRTEDATQDGDVPESSFDAEMKDVRLKYYGTTLLRWPSIRSDLRRPDTPIKSIRGGHDTAYGTSVETQWFLSRILGLRQPEGTDSTLSLDYYDKRGLGGGVDIEYERENHFGRLLGYVIDDHGEDRLSRTRKSVEVPDEVRGRLAFQHRHFLSYGWQLTAEVSYLSDKNFLEQYYRREFNIGKEQETLLHLKRIEDNWGLAFLGKARTNDFLDQVEELPSAEFHWTGQSLLGDRFTFFSDSQASRYRYRYSSDGPPGPVEPQDFFTFTQTRNELDMPLDLGKSKVVPFVAGTFAYDSGTGFQEEIDGSLGGREDTVWIGEAGVRMFAQPFWRVYPDVESRLWDLHQLRHVIRPSITAVTYAASDAVAEQRDLLDLGISQRWQTKRGPVGRRRAVDWLDLDVDFVWVDDSDDVPTGPDRMIWNTPFIPLVNRIGNVIPPRDRRTTHLFGPRRDYASAEMIMRLSDTTSVLGDVYVDMQSGTVGQLDVGFSRLCWPNLSYYVGSRYLREVHVGDERGSNAFTFAVTYVLDPRYTAVLSQQYDFDYGANIRSDITLIRKYHRLNFALTVSADESLDEERVVFSLWPEGVPELALGLRRYVGFGEAEAY